ncbi:MAG: hypothetical protein KatS3mg015_1175 [Fimbriimonadales bacterium]|nr:MAG: hypothetical protein KatS3mg015_1175 [Fimbriimonadales bacterium]
MSKGNLIGLVLGIALLGMLAWFLRAASQGESDRTVPAERLVEIGITGYFDEEPPPADRAKFEKEIFTTPRGIYTEEDVKANGNTWPSAKYPQNDFPIDLKPRPGDFIDPVLLTRADPNRSWIINGEKYYFACNQSIEEQVLRARNFPSRVRPASEFIQK